ncbi:hypothetical protein K503DRAFT_773100 [Rhizopogon vinicolor AM-OR11-026]|uniref:Uncharacterized protein n=1 Tax=Rhizopogon vinicolor AM-OR11-026 TaxID=1314800 RepID=A0A1B7MT55_9AGAM|nr:hypothetical protein K503DRAFT_773100 [Rhizopogon vinicolor AM-OR11-026]
MIVSAVAMAGIATAVDPTGGPCAKPGNYECGRVAGYNKGHGFLFFCTANAKVQVIEFCSCVECCSISYGGANGGYYICT